MSLHPVSDTWERGNPYELYIGRWSREVAPRFLAWLDPPADRRWLDVGCGTGALSAAIMASCAPASVIGADPSDGFLELAAQRLAGSARFVRGDAASLPVASASCDVVVSGLVLNFVPDLPAAIAEMIRVSAPGGTIAAYVWDYAGRMEIIKSFWDAAVSLDPAAARLHEGTRFPICAPAPLREAFERAGLLGVDTTALDLRAEFARFDDYWQPFLGGQGPAPANAMSLSEDRRAALRAKLEAALEARPNGPFALDARAWAVRGTTRGDA